MPEYSYTPRTPFQENRAHPQNVAQLETVQSQETTEQRDSGAYDCREANDAMIGCKVWFIAAILVKNDHGEGNCNRAGSNDLENPMDFSTQQEAEAEGWDVGLNEAENGFGHQDEKLMENYKIIKKKYRDNILTPISMHIGCHENS